MQLILVVVVFSVFVLLYGFFLSHFVPKRYYSFLNILMSIGSIIFARIYGLSFASMGLDWYGLTRGLLYGVSVLVPIFLAILFVLLIPQLRHFFTDQPSRLPHKRSVAYELGFRIPFGTALSEEIMFRSVLLGLLLTHYTPGVAIVCSSIVFGLWHIAPTLQTLRNNLAVKELVGEKRRFHGLSILGAVLTTSLAGIGFGFLRFWSGSVVSAWMAHSAINGFSIAGGLLAHRLHLKKQSRNSSKNNER